MFYFHFYGFLHHFIASTEIVPILSHFTYHIIVFDTLPVNTHYTEHYQLHLLKVWEELQKTCQRYLTLFSFHFGETYEIQVFPSNHKGHEYAQVEESLGAS